MLILATKLKNRFSPAYTCTLRNIRVNAEKRGCSGFVSIDGVHVYVNTEPCGSLGLMYRTAESLQDYTGGVNRWARDLDSLVKGITELLTAQRITQRTGVPAGRLIVSHIGA